MLLDLQIPEFFTDVALPMQQASWILKVHEELQ